MVALEQVAEPFFAQLFCSPRPSQLSGGDLSSPNPMSSPSSNPYHGGYHGLPGIEAGQMELLQIIPVIIPVMGCFQEFVDHFGGSFDLRGNSFQKGGIRGIG